MGQGSISITLRAFVAPALISNALAAQKFRNARYVIDASLDIFFKTAPKYARLAVLIVGPAQ
jgi:hypothetical protein